ncbi:MAG: hypothetical protein II368_04635 [Clostridia bacterium]|nr:hypothetical protein [Clostridia bacterium]
MKKKKRAFWGGNNFFATLFPFSSKKQQKKPRGGRVFRGRKLYAVGGFEQRKTRRQMVLSKEKALRRLPQGFEC